MAIKIWGTYDSPATKKIREKEPIIMKLIEEAEQEFLARRDAEKGTFDGEPTYCTVNAYGACPNCDQCNICHLPDPFDCEDWCFFWDSWDEYITY